jgi:hypothetical protein
VGYECGRLWLVSGLWWGVCFGMGLFQVLQVVEWEGYMNCRVDLGVEVEVESKVK